MNKRIWNGRIEKDFASQAFFLQLSIWQAIHLPAEICGKEGQAVLTLLGWAVLDLPAFWSFYFFCLACKLSLCLCLPVRVQFAQNVNRNQCHSDRQSQPQEQAEAKSKKGWRCFHAAPDLSEPIAGFFASHPFPN